MAGARAADSKPGPKPGQKRGPVSANLRSRESSEPPKRRKVEAAKDRQGRCGLLAGFHAFQSLRCCS